MAVTSPVLVFPVMVTVLMTRPRMPPAALSGFPEVLVTDPGQTREVTLPDGTIVTLNEASSLKYNARYGKEKREVWLDGEAFFDVKSNAECPFSIHSGILDVNVTGTSFNVCSYPDGHQTSVTVESGKIGMVYCADRMTISRESGISPANQRFRKNRQSRNRPSGHRGHRPGTSLLHP